MRIVFFGDELETLVKLISQKGPMPENVSPTGIAIGRAKGSRFDKIMNTFFESGVDLGIHKQSEPSDSSFHLNDGHEACSASCAINSTEKIHEFPLSDTDFNRLVSFCNLAGLNFHQTVALVLKSHWEDFVRDNSDVPWEDVVESCYGNMDLHKLKSRFNPDASLIFEALETIDSPIGNTGYTQQSFDALIKEMILADIHLAGIDSPEMHEFFKRAQKSCDLLQNSKKELEEKFWIVKNDWLQCHESLADLLLLMEQIRLKNAHVNWEFLLVFGEAHLVLKTESARYEKFRLRVDLVESLQISSVEELEKMVAELEANMETELASLHMEMLLAPFLRHDGNSTKECNAGEMGKYRRECKRLLREIWLLAHPDRLMHHKKYQHLTDSQKEKLKELWNKSMKVRPEETGFQDHQIGHSYRSHAILEDILASIKTILANSGIDTDINFIIKGETLGDQSDWLKTAISKLNQEIEMIRAEIKSLIENKEITKKAALLNASSAKQEQAKNEMIEKARHLKKEADKMVAYLESLFAPKTAPN